MIANLNRTIECITLVDDEESTLSEADRLPADGAGLWEDGQEDGRRDQGGTQDDLQRDQIKALLQKSQCGSYPGKRKLAALVVTLAFLLIVAAVELLMIRTVLHTNKDLHPKCELPTCRKPDKTIFEFEEVSGKWTVNIMNLLRGKWTIDILNLLRTANGLIIIASMIAPLLLVHYPLALAIKDAVQEFVQAMTPIEWVIVGIVVVKLGAKKIRSWDFAQPTFADQVKLSDPYVLLSLLVIATTVTQAILTVARYRSDHFDIKLSDVATSMARDITRNLRVVAKENEAENAKIQEVSLTECTRFDIPLMRKLMYASAGTFAGSVLMTTTLLVVTRVNGGVSII
ncbi:MAG: hypothetical protein CL902_01075 [Dehalococcoidia bacterium]|nr:hypothetical protein [Dehalococcoidia bacterium]